MNVHYGCSGVRGRQTFVGDLLGCDRHGGSRKNRRSARYGACDDGLRTQGTLPERASRSSLERGAIRMDIQNAIAFCRCCNVLGGLALVNEIAVRAACSLKG